MQVHTIQLNIQKLMGGTSHMDAQEFGAYLSLLVCAYQTNGKLPDDDKRLARMARCSTRIWKRIRPEIEGKFIISDGFWSHKEVSKQLVKYRKLSEKNRANRLKNNETQKPEVNDTSTSGRTNINNQEPVTNEDISLSKDNSCISCTYPDRSGNEHSFKDVVNFLWKLYPRVGRAVRGKGKFEDEVKKFLEKGGNDEAFYRGRLTELAGHIKRYKDYCEATGEKQPDAFRWMRNKGYADEYSYSEAGSGRGEGYSLASAHDQALADTTGRSEGRSERLARLGIE